MKRIFLFVIPFLFFSAAFLSEGADEVIQKLNEHLARYPQEKAYIHFDKPYYSVGETIWFKAYLLGAEKSNPQALSSLIRAELIDPNNKIISKRELKVTQGGAAGDFLLPETLDPGKYTVRAYTNWMRNFDNDYFFRKSFEVVKTYVSDSLQEVSSPAGGKLNMKFFPEGGDLVSGLASIVGFKVVDENGLGVNVIGEILDTSGTSLTTFESSFVGIGKFLLKPQYGINYYARISINGKSQEFQLPDTKQEGCIMRVNNGYKSDKVTVAITSNGVNLTSGFVIGHQNGNVFSKIVNKGLKSSFGIGLDSEIFPSGICHLTFFDASGTALTERIVLVKHEPVRVKVEMEADREVYETRQLAALKLKLTTADSSDVLGNVSVSITPKEIITYTANYQNIKNYLLLSSDLKGYIEQPEYYFQQSEESFRALDNLMLTQGWRRFTWKSVLSDSGIQSQFLAEDGITVSGQLFDLYAIEKPRSGRVSMSIFDGTFNYLEGETDDDGKFIFASLDFEDSTDLMIQGERIIGKKGKSDDNVFIKLDPVTEPIVDAEFISETPFQTKLDANYLSEKKKIEKIDRAFDLDKEAIILDAVEIFSRKDYSNDPFRSRTQYYSEPSARLAF
ncbi:MAG: MG2 domain-containing protein, partial [Cyclobacteriaceae bacterium]